MDRSIGTIFTFMMMIQVGLFLTQVSLDQIAIDEGITSPVPQVFTYEGSVISQYDSGDYTLDGNVTGILPTSVSEVEPETGNFFTDLFATMRNWAVETIPGARYIKPLATSVPNSLKIMGLPDEISFALGTLWYAIALLIIISYLFGK